MAVSKVVYGNQTLIDLTGDTVTADTLLAGTTAHSKAGVQLTGTAVIPTKTSDLINDSGFITASDNVATATKLQTARAIDGLEFDGTTDVTRYVLCETAAATSPKVVTVPNFKLVTGAEVTIRFAATNSKTSPTLNVSGTGEKQIRYRNAALSTSTTRAYLAANRIYKFVYDGEYWQIVGDIDTNTNNVTAQNISTANDTYPMLLGNTANATANIGNKATLFGAGIKANPSTSEITATGFIGDLTGTASNATADASGNVITTTYATKAEIPTVPTDVSAFTNDAGYITGITSSDVTSALGFTPANSTALSGYLPLSSGTEKVTFSGTPDASDNVEFFELSANTRRAFFWGGTPDSSGALALAGSSFIGTGWEGSAAIGACDSSGNLKWLRAETSGQVAYNNIPFARYCLPSTTYRDLTLPASGGSVTVPDDGWVLLEKAATAAGQYIYLQTPSMRARTFSTGGNTLDIYVPVNKGDTVQVAYSAAGTTGRFRFYYANGSVWAAS